MRPLFLCILLAASLLAQSALEQAIVLTRQHEYQKAREALKGTQEPQEPRQRVLYYRLRAAIASGLNEHAQAAAEMRSALAIAPRDQGLLLATAAAELAAGKLDDALAHSHDAGNIAAAQELMGEIQEKRGDYIEAAKAYQSAVALAPDREEYRIALALEFVQHQTFQPAIDVLEQAAPLFPKSARIRTLLGLAHYAQGNLEQATAALTDAIQVDPKMEPAYAYLAKVLLESSAAPPQAAFAALCQWDQTVCGALKIRIAREQSNEKLMAEGVQALEKAPADNPVGQCELGRGYEWANRRADARIPLERCVKLDPSPQNHYRLAQLYQSLGQPELARKEIALRDKAIKDLSEEAARRVNATQAFRVAAK